MSQKSRFQNVLPWLCAGGLLAGCAGSAERDPIPPVAEVDIPRFMGDWYVIAHIPTFFERDAYNAVEHYEQADDGRIETTYRQRGGSFEAQVKSYHPTGFVREEGNGALWGMQFVWPIKAEYRIVALSDDYAVTIVGRNKRDYVWLMSRTPDMSDADYARWRERIAAMGYDVNELRRVPQRWPEAADQ